MLRENVEREDLDIEDLGQYLRTLAEAGATQRELAALTRWPGEVARGRIWKRGID